MKNNRKISRTPVGAQSGSAIVMALILLVVGFFGYTTYERIHEVHRELFNAEAPLDLSFDLENFKLIAKTKITSQPRPNSFKFGDLPHLNKPLVYRITHELGIGEHSGAIELKVSDNGLGMEFLSSDILVKFTVGSDDVSISIPPFNYEVPSMSLRFGELNGTYGRDGFLKLNISNVEAKMVNYLFKSSGMVVEIPGEQHHFRISAKTLTLDEVTINNPSVSFKGVDPMEINLNSKFNNKPVEVRWSIQKSNLNKQDLRIGSGLIKFPTELLDAYIEPRVNMLLLSQEKEASISNSEKIRFLFSAAKEVRRSEARTLALRQMSFAKNIKREGDFYLMRIDKQDAFKSAEELSAQSLIRKEYVEAWLALPKDKMFEEAFYAVVFGNEDRVQAVKDLMTLKENELRDDPLFALLKARVSLSDAVISPDEYDPTILGNAIQYAEEAAKKNPDHKLSLLLKLEIAKARDDKTSVLKISEDLKTKEQNPQVLALLEYVKDLHVDYKKSLEYLEAANTLDPKSPAMQNYLRYRIHILHHTGDKENAKKDFETLFSSSRIYPTDLLNYSKLLEEDKKLDESLKTVEKCLQMNPAQKDCNDQRENIMTLIAYEKQKQNQDEAISYLENILVDRPASIPVNAGLGFLYRMKGTSDKSINHYSIACALGGKTACLEAGDFLNRSGDQDKAILLYDVSCDLQSGQGCTKAGLFSEKSGQIEKSGIFFDRACNQLKDNVGCYHLARNMQHKRMANKEIVPYLTKACMNYPSACKLATVYRTTNKQPAIPLEPK